MKNYVQEVMSPVSNFRFPFEKYFRKRAEKRFFTKSTTEEIFCWIYRTNKWGNRESCSGSGSNIEQTQTLRKELPKLFKRLEVNTLLDIPCGDFYWMQHMELDIEQYIGADIVGELILNNVRKYQQPARQFMQLDLTKDTLPHCDALLCRDCFVHLSNEMIDRAIQNIKSSNSRYLITTTHTLHKTNRDKLTGKHHLLNLQRPPFCWPEPLNIIVEDSAPNVEDTGKSLGVWRIVDILTLPN